jgi:hypothetical protein
MNDKQNNKRKTKTNLTKYFLFRGFGRTATIKKIKQGSRTVLIRDQ